MQSGSFRSNFANEKIVSSSSGGRLLVIFGCSIDKPAVIENVLLKRILLSSLPGRQLVETLRVKVNGTWLCMYIYVYKGDGLGHRS